VPSLGRPKKALQKALIKQEREDVSIRNSVEGKFGEAKRKYGLNLIKARLKETAETVIALQFLVMNLERKLRFLFDFFLRPYCGINLLKLQYVACQK
jgi:hypothetical protein